MTMIVSQETHELMVTDKKALPVPRQSGIYQIRCKPTGKSYIGSAVWLAKRKRHHREALLSGAHCNSYLQRAWDKYGNDEFEYSVLEYCKKEKLIEREQYYIDLLKVADKKHGFNLQPKAYSNLGVTYSPEAIANFSAAAKARGCNFSPEQIEALRKRMKGNTFALGMKHSEESRKKMKIARKGRVPALGMHHTDESKKKISISHKGIKLSPEHREKISQAHLGKKHTAEHRKNLAIATAKFTPEQIELIRTEYVPGVVTMRHIAKKHGCCAQTICNVINHGRVIYK